MNKNLIISLLVILVLLIGGYAVLKNKQPVLVEQQKESKSDSYMQAELQKAQSLNESENVIAYTQGIEILEDPNYPSRIYILNNNTDTISGYDYSIDKDWLENEIIKTSNLSNLFHYTDSDSFSGFAFIQFKGTKLVFAKYSAEIGGMCITPVLLGQAYSIETTSRGVATITPFILSTEITQSAKQWVDACETALNNVDTTDPRTFQITPPAPTTLETKLVIQKILYAFYQEMPH